MNRELIDSGIEWIGKIPNNWKLERLQWHLDEIVEKNNPVKTTNILSLTNKLGVVPYSEKGNQGNVAKENLDEYKVAYPNTIVANSMNILIGSVGYCNYYGCVSPVYYVYKAKENNNIIFWNYLFQTQQFQKELRKYANGILEIRLRLSSDNILKRYVAIPSKDEQQKIVDILNKKVSQIDALVLNQENQIEKLKEYKQSLITKIVTKGLNKNVEMKDSGVDSIGLVPAHWQVSRAKYIFNDLLKGAGISKEEVFSNGNIQCVRYGEIYTKYDISFKQTFSKTIEDKITTKVYLNYGDIIFSATGELVEEIGKNVVYLGNDKCLAGGDIIIGRHSQNPKFLNYAMYCSASQMQKSKGKAKLKVVHISATNIGNIIVAIPNISEQNEIASYLDEKCSKIDKLIEIKHSKIEKLQEYKKSIIYEYVTGKKLVD